MAQHNAAVTVNAPVHQVYELFSHFNDYPKFMTHIKEVTYYDKERSHWVTDVVGRHEWDAVNADWIPDKQIGWRSTQGLKNSGVVRFEPVAESQTRVRVMIAYDPPAGALGDLGEVLGAGKSLEKALQTDLENFARMVEEAPAGALDPESSDYLFNEDSAAARGKTTRAQDQTMGQSAKTVTGTGSGGVASSGTTGGSFSPTGGTSGASSSTGAQTDDVDTGRPREDWPNTTSPADKTKPA